MKKSKKGRIFTAFGGLLLVADLVLSEFFVWYPSWLSVTVLLVALSLILYGFGKSRNG